MDHIFLPILRLAEHPHKMTASKPTTNPMSRVPTTPPTIAGVMFLCRDDCSVPVITPGNSIGMCDTTCTQTLTGTFQQSRIRRPETRVVANDGSSAYEGEPRFTLEGDHCSFSGECANV